MELSKKVEKKSVLWRKFKKEIESDSYIKVSKISTDILSLSLGENKILIIDAITDNPVNSNYSASLYRSEGMTTYFFDKNFNTLAHLVNYDDPEYLELIKKDKKNNALLKYLEMSLISNNKTKKERIKNYNGHHDYYLKKFFSECFKIPFTADNEFFLFSNDEYQPRFRNSTTNKLKINHGDKIIMKDNSALLVFDKEGGLLTNMSIILKDYDSLIIGKKIFYGISKISRMVRCPPEEGTLVSMAKANGSRKHFKMVLKKNADISELESSHYQLCQNMIFIFNIDKKNKTFFLTDSNGNKIGIGHPDLLIEVIK